MVDLCVLNWSAKALQATDRSDASMSRMGFVHTPCAYGIDSKHSFFTSIKNIWL